MLPCDLAFGARVYVAQTILGDQEYRFVVLAAGDGDVYGWWKGDTKRLVGGIQINTTQPLKIIGELNVTPNSLVVFDATTDGYDDLHHDFWSGKDGASSNFSIHHQRLRQGTMHWHDGFTESVTTNKTPAVPAARYSDNTQPPMAAQRQSVSLPA